MKIIFGTNYSELEEHAKKTVRAQQRKDAREGGAPMGVAHHTARHPIVCDDCGATFWARDPWGSHIGCPGEPKKGKAGF